MTTALIESLPNELWLSMMSFLSAIDLYRALFGLNHRIDSLISVKNSHITLDASHCDGSGIRLTDMRQLFEGDYSWSKHLLSSIRTIRLNDTLTSNALCEGYRSHIHYLSKNTFSTLFPSLQRLYVTEGVRHEINILKLLLPMSNSLRYLHYTVSKCCSSYFKMLSTFADKQISFYSMVFDVEKDYMKDNWSYSPYEWKTMYLINTVHLSLFVTRLSDLFILLDTQVSPILDHFSATFIDQDERSSQDRYEMKTIIHITSRLRTLKLNHMSLANLLIFLSSVHMNLLEKLTLLDIYDSTLDRLNDFQNFFHVTKNMPTLRPSSFRFLLRFPGELEEKWTRYRNLEWPLTADNIDHCLEEQRLSCVTYWRSKLLSPTKKYYLLIFTRSSLPYHRNIHNYSFTSKLKQRTSTSSITWTCDHMNSSEQMLDALSKFQTTKKLEIIKWRGTKLQNASAKLVIFPSPSNRLQLDKLHSLTFESDEKETFLQSAQQHALFQILLSAIPQLVKLDVNWNLVMNIDSTFGNGTFVVSPLPNLRHLHLFHYNEHGRICLTKLIDMSVLSKYLPKLTTLSTGGANLYLDENFANLVISIVTHFNHLIELVINKGSRYRENGIPGLDLLLSQQGSTENLLRNTPKLSDRNRTDIYWPTNYPELRVWL